MTIDLNQLVFETVADIDHAGQPWPENFMTDLPEDDRERLRQLEQEIDRAVLAGDYMATKKALAAYRDQVMDLKTGHEPFEQQNLFAMARG